MEVKKNSKEERDRGWPHSELTRTLGYRAEDLRYVIESNITEFQRQGTVSVRREEAGGLIYVLSDFQVVVLCQLLPFKNPMAQLICELMHSELQGILLGYRDHIPGMVEVRRSRVILKLLVRPSFKVAVCKN